MDQFGNREGIRGKQKRDGKDQILITHGQIIKNPIKGA
jgi:hypothetical protein